MSRACLLEQIENELYKVERTIGIEMLVLTHVYFA